MLQPENSWAGCTALLDVCVCFLTTPSTRPLLLVHNLLIFYLPIEIRWFCSTCHVRITLDQYWPWVSSRDETSHKWDYHIDLGWVRASRLACVTLSPCSAQDPWVCEKRGSGPHCTTKEGTWPPFLVVTGERAYYFSGC